MTLTPHQVTVLRAERDGLREVQAGAPEGTWEHHDATMRLRTIARLLGDLANPQVEVEG